MTGARRIIRIGAIALFAVALIVAGLLYERGQNLKFIAAVLGGAAGLRTAVNSRWV